MTRRPCRQSQPLSPARRPRPLSIVPAFIALPVLAAGADVRVFTDLATFQAETGAARITSAYPANLQTASFTSGPVTFTRSGGGLFFADWTPALPGNDLAISGVENFDLSFAPPYLHAVGIELIEPIAQGCNAEPCLDSTFEVSVFGNADVSALGLQAELHRQTFDFPNDQVAFIGFASNRRIARVAFREISGSDDNEYFGAVHGSAHRTTSIPAGIPVRVQEFNQPIDYPVPFERTFDFGQLPLAGQYRAVHDAGLEIIASGSEPWVHVDGSPLGMRAARQVNAQERWTLSLPPGTYAVEFDFLESTLTGGAADSCFNSTCFDTRYELTAYNGPDPIREQRFSAWNDRVTRYALWSSVPIDRLDLRGEFNNSDDELLGRIRVGSRPLPPEFPQRIASADGRQFGRQVSVTGDFAVATDAGGFSTWQRAGHGWDRIGWRALASVPERVAADAGNVVIARRNGSGVLEIHERSGGPPGAWPAPVEFPYSGAARDLAVDGDLVALGQAGRVRLFRREPGGWQDVGQLLPPGGSNNRFGLGLGLSGDVLVVGAGGDTFRVYRRGSNGQFIEEFHQNVGSASGASILDVSDERIAQQGFSGEIRIYEPAGGGSWIGVGTLAAPLPFTAASVLGAGVDIDGRTLIARRSFFDSGAPDFRDVIELWQQNRGNGWSRTYVLADPHLNGDLAAELGGIGLAEAMSLSGDAFWLGQPASPWCVGDFTSFFGDNGGLGYRDETCGSRSGAAFVGSVVAIDAPLFIDDFESAP